MGRECSRTYFGDSTVVSVVALVLIRRRQWEMRHRRTKSPLSLAQLTESFSPQFPFHSPMRVCTSIVRSAKGAATGVQIRRLISMQLHSVAVDDGRACCCVTVKRQLKGGLLLLLFRARNERQIFTLRSK